MEKARGNCGPSPGRVTPVGEFLAYCADRLAGEHVVMAGADRYKADETLDVLDTLRTAGIAWPIVWRGTGAHPAADGSHDIRALQRLIYGDRLAVSESLLLRTAISVSPCLRFDGAGNPALDKRRNASRIDALSAAVISAGLGEMHGNRPMPEPTFMSINP